MEVAEGKSKGTGLGRDSDAASGVRAAAQVCACDPFEGLTICFPKRNRFQGWL